MAALFDEVELGDYLQYEVSEAAAASAERAVWGWLKQATGLTERPDTVSDEMFSWAIELGAIAHENPSSLSTYTIGDETSGWQRDRRQEILDAAAAGGSDTPSRTGPRGSFPPAQSWPDPACGGYGSSS